MDFDYLQIKLVFDNIYHSATDAYFINMASSLRQFFKNSTFVNKNKKNWISIKFVWKQE